MGIQQLKLAFADALGDGATVATFALGYDRHNEVESQILTASGTWADGSTFSIKSDKLRAGSDLLVATRQLAERLLGEKQ